MLAQKGKKETKKDADSKAKKEAKEDADPKAKKAEAFAAAMAKHRPAKADKKDCKAKKGAKCADAEDKAALEKKAIDVFAKALANARVKGDGEKKCVKNLTPDEYDEKHKESCMYQEEKTKALEAAMKAHEKHESIRKLYEAKGKAKKEKFLKEE